MFLFTANSNVLYKVFVSQNDCTKVTHFSKWESRPVYFQSNVNIYHGSYKYEVYFYSCLHDWQFGTSGFEERE